MDGQTAEKLKHIKQELHSMMNGTASASMREKGLGYRVIFGVEWPRLVWLATEYGKDETLAAALWHEDIRECRLLAGLVMPADAFAEQMADIWVESMHYPEEAQYTAMSLFQHLPYARSAAYRWIADGKEMFQLCGYLTLARLFMKGDAMEAREENEFLDQAKSATHTGNASLRNAIRNALLKYSLIGKREAKRAEEIIDEMEKEGAASAG